MRSIQVLGTVAGLLLGGSIFSMPSFADRIAEKVMEQPKLEVVAELEQRPANIAVTFDGRIIVSLHPFDKPSTKMIVINKDGTTEPFPDAEWNREGGPDFHSIGFSNVMGVRASTRGSVFVLDLGDENFAPRVIEFDVLRRRLVGMRYIPRNFTTAQSFLQDFAINWDNNHLYIADMGQADLSKPAQPAVIDLDMTNGIMYRILGDHPSVQPPETPLEIYGKVLTFEKDGRDVPVRAALNSITLDIMQDNLYYAPMGEGKLYRVPLSKMSDVSVSEDAVIKRIEIVGDKPASDGITVDAEENVYITAIGKNEIGVIDKSGHYRPYLQDERLQWADGLSFGPDGYIYVTISRLHEHPFFNHGAEPAEKKPYLIARFKPIAEGGIGR
ncbi:MAG: hypothetical protein KDJ50_10345 [Alphaproteobacteria bacterium]|nr:hypothetical protein [Alphaproteobacteria bacterium]